MSDFFRSGGREVAAEKMFVGYGCHCQQNDNHASGSGEPKDEIDRTCQKMNAAIRCLKHENDNCHPNSPYQWKIKKSGEGRSGVRTSMSALHRVTMK